jgi:hypothetical protein
VWLRQQPCLETFVHHKCKPAEVAQIILVQPLRRLLMLPGKATNIGSNIVSFFNAVGAAATQELGGTPTV